ncbi:uncharacterized protein LOC125654410 isoform X2 [Ostrea edulis]|uniref:uncharacterized protein LOC125654410 isoform X2 n=1 Tax=Ostrea edulis TaxID=37623 RepID=UPI0024AF9586|nr:uncharacterized protein LOC125654410 isoform X2 [Ostrea edulis]
MDRSVFIVLISLALLIQAVDGSVMCPYLTVWEAHSQMFCEDPTHYHCLENQKGDLTEACLEPVFIDSGHYPVLSIDSTFITPVKCPSTHYQPGGQMSNRYKHVTCMYPKSLCDDDGEEKCDDGSDITDRMCRCDYTKGYRSQAYLFSNPKNQSCYKSKSEEEGCAMLGCPEGKELNPAYFCVKECAPGSHRRKHEFHCVRNDTVVISTVKSITETSMDVEVVTNKPVIMDDMPGNVLYHYWRKRRGSSDSKDGGKSEQGIEIKQHPPTHVTINAGTYIEKIVVEDAHNVVTGDKSTVVIGNQSSND